MTRQPDSDSEARLDALRQEAARTGHPAGSGAIAAGGPMPASASPSVQAAGSYYGLPALKGPVWTWEVPLYFFVGGIAGASALMALAARLTRGEANLEHAALWVALVAALVSPALLIADLGRPKRFLNMLRVFKWQSPMSVGAWTLVLFTIAVVVALVMNVAVRAGLGPGVASGVSWAAEGAAAATGLVLLSYTAVLLGITAIPVWSENRNVLPAHFVASGIGSASAVLELLGFLVPATEWMGLAISGWETLVGIRLEFRHCGVNRPLRRGRSGWTARAGGFLAGPLALLVRLGYGPSSAGGREFAAISFLAGALLTRYAWVMAGRASAADPQALFVSQRSSRAR